MKVRDNWYTTTNIRSGAGSIVHFQISLLKAAATNRILGVKSKTFLWNMINTGSWVTRGLWATLPAWAMSNFDSSTMLATWLYQIQCKDRSKCTSSFINIQFVSKNLNDSREYVQSYKYDLFRKLAIEVLFGLSVWWSDMLLWVNCPNLFTFSLYKQDLSMSHENKN